jgi:hypothetical protein
MAAEDPKKVEVEAAPEPEVAAPVPAAEPEAPAKDVTEEKAVVPAEDSKPPVDDDSKALVVVEKVADEPVAEKPADEKPPQGGSNDRDIALTRVETEKRNSLIKAWEENEKTKAENKAAKKVSAILSWENTKKANIEAQLRKIEVKFHCLPISSQDEAHSWVVLYTYQYLPAIPTTALFSYGVLCN